MLAEDRTKNVLIAVLAAGCLSLAASTAWALTTRNVEPIGGPQFWVAPDGDDAGSGSRDDPWATLQKASDEGVPGATIFVRGGTYDQRFAVEHSGEVGQPISIVAEPGEQPILDGSSLDVPAGQSAMVSIDGQHDVVVDGLEITGYRSDVSGAVPIGVFVTGAAENVELTALKIHDLGTTFDGRNGGDAHGIAVYGTSASSAISGLTISGNELHDLTLGSSEALVVNGNVKDFLIEGNVVHDTNNIGIDVIGFEGTASDPTVDQARDGIVRGNEVWNVDSRGNPAYGNDGSADGIYVDGGRDVLVEANVVHDVNIGIELASEHAGRATRNITVRNNLVYETTTIGLAVGGYDRRRGSTENCTVVNNTVVRSAGPLVLVQFDTRDNVVANNILVSGDHHSFVENRYAENVANIVDYNLYWAEDGLDAGIWEWKGKEYGRFTRWQERSGNDQHSAFSDPRFVDATAHDYAVRANSAAVNAGLRLAVAGAEDLRGEARSQGSAIDLGAYELSVPAPTPTPEISGVAIAIGDLEWISQKNGWGPVEQDQSNGERPAGDGLPLTVNGSTFDNGLGTHAPSRVVFARPEGCSAFYADVGLDDEVGDQGTVVFEVYGDGKLLVTSGLVFATDEPVPLSADVSQVGRVALVVTPGGDGNAFDHADWADARLDCATP